MNIVYVATRKYYPFLRWSIKSLLEHNKPSCIYVLAEDDELPYEIPCKHKIINVSNQEYFKEGSPNMTTPFSYLCLMRVCIPELIKAAKVIQLDVDTVICDSLKPLWDTDLNGKWVAWCPERFGTYRPHGAMYYNAGVAVLNLSQMRKDNATEQLVGLLNTGYYRFVDQDALNLLAVPNKTVDIDIRFNECFCCGETDNPSIVHYAGHQDWYENKTMYRWEYLAKYQEG